MMQVFPVSAQDDGMFELLTEESSLLVKGSSTLHDWDVEATEYSLEWSMPGEWPGQAENGKTIQPKKLVLEVAAAGMDGGRNKMNRDMREALRAEQHPHIRFKGESITLNRRTDASDTLEITGEIEVAGIPRQIQVQAELTVQNNGNLQVRGSVPLDMEDFGIDPPRAMLGLIRTDPEIELHFNLQFKAVI